MKSIFLRLICAIGLVLAFFWLVGSLLPRSYSIRSSVNIARPAEDVFPMINDLRNWDEWSPWGAQAELDVRYSGEEQGIGSVQTWTDPRGDGKLWIIGSQPNQSVTYKMYSGDFPEMDSHFELTEAGEATEVTWTSEGTLPSGAFYGYFSWLFAPGMRAEYGRALARLKSVVEKRQ